MLALDPSGRSNVNRTLSPATGFVAPRSSETWGGTPAGPMAVAPVSDDEIAASLKPKAVAGASSLIATAVGDGAASRVLPRRQQRAHDGLVPPFRLKHLVV